MKLIEINLNPTDRQLRQFGAVCVFALPVIAWFWGGDARMVGSVAIVGLFLAAAGFARPRALKPVFLVLTVVTAPIGIVIGELAMAAVYLGVFLPIGLAFRLMRRNALQLRFNKRAETYWQDKKPPGRPADYYRQS
jgi:hypothetical protein